MTIQNRKKDHVDLCVQGDVGYRKSAGFEYYDFLHNALPEVSFDEIDTKASLLGRDFSFPLFISSMTGGYSGAVAVNEIIARFCEKENLPFGVGSQRAMLEAPEETESFSVVRKNAPNAFIAANIGGVQLAAGLTDDDLSRLTDSIEANAVIVHLNPLQELMQPEGDRDFRGILDGITSLCSRTSLPVIVKETGAGISEATARKLLDAGVKAIDVAGAGGTSWSRVENLRAGTTDSGFDEWGIPTIECITNLHGLIKGKAALIASGGIKSSFDMAKAICLGAVFTASAGPVISAVVNEGEEGLQRLYSSWKKDFTTIMCLLGVREVSGLSPYHLVRRR